MFPPSYFAPEYFAPRYFPPDFPEPSVPSGGGGGGGAALRRPGRILRFFPEFKEELERAVLAEAKFPSEEVSPEIIGVALERLTERFREFEEDVKLDILQAAFEEHQMLRGVFSLERERLRRLLLDNDALIAILLAASV